jgi:hypothetical protein
VNNTGKHVPAANPANFVWLEMHDTKDIVLSRDGQPLLSVTLRAVHGERIGLQITAVKSSHQVRDPRLPPVERTPSDSTATSGEAKP